MDWFLPSNVSLIVVRAVWEEIVMLDLAR